MQVFKAFFLVIRKNMVSMLVYMFVFIFLIILMTLFYQQAPSLGFNARKVQIALINQDQGHPFSDGLADWLAQESVLIDIPDSTTRLQDALFYREVSYILRIPAGFGTRFLQGDYETGLIRTQVPDSYTGVQMDLLVERYLNLAALYNEMGSTDAAALSDAVKNDMKIAAEVSMHTASENSGSDRMGFYYLYLAYTIIAVMSLGVTTVMLVFNKNDLRRRNLSSPVSLISFNKQLVLGFLVFALGFWLLVFILSILLTGSSNISKLLLLGLNALVFILACLSLGFFISQFVRSRAAQIAIANVLALGTSFISGVFVPREFLGKTVQTIASFTPTYWYTRAVYEINGLSQYPLSSLSGYAVNILIQLGFAVALLAVALVVIKNKRQTREQ